MSLAKEKTRKAGDDAKAPSLDVDGRVIGLVGSRLVGWARDRLRADEPVVVELVINGEVVGKIAADGPPVESSPSPDSPPPPGNCWFSIRIPIEYRTGRVLNLDVQTEASPAVLGPSIQTRLHGALSGKLVDIRDGYLLGWASNTVDPSEPVELELRVDGALCSRFLANLPATSSKKRRFVEALPTDIRDGEIHQVSVCWAGGRDALPGSPIAWRAPEPGPARPIALDKLPDRTPLRSRPKYVLPRAETVVAEALIAHDALMGVLPDVMREQRERLRRGLFRLPAQASTRRRVHVLASATSLSDLDGCFGLTQLLESPDLDVLVRLAMPTEEAVRFMSDRARTDRVDQLAAPLVFGDVGHLLNGMADDDLVCFLPSRTVLLAGFFQALDRVARGDLDAVVGYCDVVGLGVKGAVRAVQTPPAHGKSDPSAASWDAVGVGKVSAMRVLFERRVADFEGVPLSELRLGLTGGASTLGTKVIAAELPPANDVLRAGAGISVLTPVADLATETRALLLRLNVRCRELGAGLVIVAPVGAQSDSAFAAQRLKGARILFEQDPRALNAEAWNTLGALVAPDRLILVAPVECAAVFERTDLWAAAASLAGPEPRRLDFHLDAAPAAALDMFLEFVAGIGTANNGEPAILIASRV